MYMCFRGIEVASVSIFQLDFGTVLTVVFFVYHFIPKKGGVHTNLIKIRYLIAPGFAMSRITRSNQRSNFN